MKRILVTIMLCIACLVGCSNGESSTDMRIISLMPSNTEIIHDLDLSNEIVAITTVDTYPESLVNDDDIAKVNNFELDVEALIDLNPTHIVSHESAQSMQSDILNQVKDATNAKLIFVGDAESVDDVYETIEDIGEFLNVEDKAEALATKLEADVNAVADQYDGNETSALLLVSLNPEIYVVGGSTFISDLLSQININNVFEDIEGYPLVSAESLVTDEAEYLISLTGEDEEALVDSVQSIPGISDAQIADSQYQCAIDQDLISRPSTRIDEALETVGQCVYE